MKEDLLLIFAKNIILGKVKTRLAKTVGDTAAFNVYRELIAITEEQTQRMKNCDVHVYFSDVVINALWVNHPKFVQHGDDLGQRRQNAFKDSFNKGYKRVIGIGSDLPDLNVEIMTKGLDQLKSHDTVFGPSEDGGYYLIGMTQLIPQIFENKEWSTESLLDITTSELKDLDYTTALLETLNDVDTIEDLKNSSLAGKFSHIIDNA